MKYKVGQKEDLKESVRVIGQFQHLENSAPRNVEKAFNNHEKQKHQTNIKRAVDATKHTQEQQSIFTLIQILEHTLIASLVWAKYMQTNKEMLRGNV